MEERLISVRDLTKIYRVPVRAEGLASSFKSLLRPQFTDIEAVNGISFEISAGEMVGLIGPNGAGKTTTLKILSGLMHPSEGDVRVAGFIPWERKKDYLRRISMVMGNKSQMLWDIPPMDSFRVLGEIYGVPANEFKRNLDELVSLLEIKEVLTKPVRNLSLGERMKCELAASLLHRPQVLFLDEPTLGMDVSMQLRLRRFLADYNRSSGATMILTSHYMADVVALCSRVVLIHHGRLLHDGALSYLAKGMIPFKMLRITLGAEQISQADLPALPDGAEVISIEENVLNLRIPHAKAASITTWLLKEMDVVDLTVEDPAIESVIDQVYQGGEA
jgi:ABC-2 type transport system ATP-binding protein